MLLAVHYRVMEHLGSLESTQEARVALGYRLGQLLRPVYIDDFLSRQLEATFVAPKLQLQNRTCKPGAICRRDIARVSNMFETCCNFSATKIASSCCDKNRLCKRAFTLLSCPPNFPRAP